MSGLSDEAVAVLAARPAIIDIHDVRKLLDDAVALACEVQERRARRSIAGPFEPVEDIDWCTLHHGVRNEDESRCDFAPAPADCHDDDDVSVDDHGQCDDCRCELVTLYIEVQA